MLAIFRRLRCAVLGHSWFYSSSSNWRWCAKCGIEQTTDKRGSVENWEWK